jgi:hypothetical protein
VIDETKTERSTPIFYHINNKGLTGMPEVNAPGVTISDP